MLFNALSHVSFQLCDEHSTSWQNICCAHSIDVHTYKIIYLMNLCTISEPLVNRFRRKSVFAETYDPENDADEDEGAAAIFPKSDEQRARLIESVKNILLFRSLDKEQVSYSHSFR